MVILIVGVLSGLHFELGYPRPLVSGRDFPDGVWCDGFASTRYHQVLLTQGLYTSIRAGLIYVPLMECTTTGFVKNKSLVTAVASPSTALGMLDFAGLDGFR